MQLKVGQLDEYLSKREESAFTAKLGDLSISDDATTLTAKDGLSTKNWSLDTTAAHALNKYLKVPIAYYDKLTPDFRTQVLRYEFERNKDVDTTIETLNDEIVAVHQPAQVMLPLNKVAGVIGKVFTPDDTVRRMIASGERFHVDVTTTAHKLVLEDTQMELGDITEAGVRFLAYPFRSVAPSANLYAERLVCMNGMTTDERFGRISLKGRTVDEVIAEMEQAANLLLPQLDEYLDKLGQTRQMYPPGTPQAFAAQLAREAKVKREVLDKVLDIVNQLPEPVTIWDVNQAFTSVANEVETYEVMTRLQTVGGQLAFDAERAIERCHSCERLL